MPSPVLAVFVKMDRNGFTTVGGRFVVVVVTESDSSVSTSESTIITSRDDGATGLIKGNVLAVTAFLAGGVEGVEVVDVVVVVVEVVEVVVGFLVGVVEEVTVEVEVEVVEEDRCVLR